MVVFKVSKIFGVFPYGHDGLSRIWGLYSLFLHGFYVRSISLRVIPLISSFSGIDNYVYGAFLTVLYGPAFCQIWRFLMDPTFIVVADTAVKSRQYPVEIALVAPKLVMYCGVYFLFNKKDLRMLATVSASFLVNIQYCLIIRHFARLVSDLRQKIKYFPVSATSELHRLSILTQKAHDKYSPAVLMSIFLYSVSAGNLAFLTLVSPMSKLWMITIAVISEDVYSVLFIVGQCSEFEKQFDAFYEELFRVVWKRPDLCRNNKLVLYLRIRPKVNFSACGFFTLGYPLVTSIVAAVTVYLSVLVQFHNS